MNDVDRCCLPTAKVVLSVLKEFPVARRHTPMATLFSTGIARRKRVSFLKIGG